MSSTDIFWAIGDLFQMVFVPFEIIGNTFNYFLIATVGFGGLFYWLNLQRKFDAAAEKDPNQRK